MPTLQQWRTILKESFEVGLGPALGETITAYSYPTPSADAPCVVVFPGGPATYIDTDSNTEGVTVTMLSVRWGALLITGRPGEEASFDLLDEWIDRLDEVAALAQTNPLNSDGTAPDIDSVQAPRTVTYGGTEYVAAMAELSLPIPLQ